MHKHNASKPNRKFILAAFLRAFFRLSIWGKYFFAATVLSCHVYIGAAKNDVNKLIIQIKIHRALEITKSGLDAFSNIVY